MTSCLGKDSNYELKAQIGTFENPFTITGLAGINATTTTARPVSTSSLVGSTGSPPPSLGPSKPSSSAIAGAVIGALLAFFLVATAAYLFLRHAKKRKDLEEQAAENEKNRVPELHDKDATIHMKETKENSHEAPGSEPPELKGDEYACEADSGEIYEMESPKNPRSWFGM